MSKSKKIISKILLLILVIVASLSAFACGGSASATCKITFKEEGYPTIVKYVERGETLTDIPEVHTKEGYDVFWNISDFTNIRKSMVVYANSYAKRYKVTFNISYKNSSFERNNLRVYNVSNYEESLSGLNTNKVYYDTNTGEFFQVVIYDKYFELLKPSDGLYYIFSRWAIDSTLYEHPYAPYYNQINGSKLQDKVIWKYTENKSVTAIYISYIHA
ncbi:MAG: hypothetical protein J6Q32_02780 [Clostridia bacterium]|nr:hypothetical protein [Clostridia bacterium]